jgi:peptide chain release factor 1
VFEGHLETHKQGIDPRDIAERVTRGTGAGGQNRNKRETVVILKHLPSGIEVKAEAERTQESNRRVAQSTLQDRVLAHYATAQKRILDADRKGQLGGGARGDKIRTYRSDGVTDHRTNRRAPLTSIEAGKLELLWA